MASLDDLLKMDGVVFACELTADGKIISYKSNTDVPRDLADKAAQYIATVTMMFNTLAGSFSQLSQMNWTPHRVWGYSGGDWAVMASPNQAIFAQLDKVDTNKLREMMHAPAEEEAFHPSL